jgi:hypothetical protein
MQLQKELIHLCTLILLLTLASPARATKKIVRSVDMQESNGSFDYTRYETESYVYILCWAAENCGTCPMSVAAGGSNEFDPTDLLAQKQLFTNAESEVKKNNYVGSVKKAYQVDGETNIRIYKATWMESENDYIQMNWSRIQ